MITKYGLPQVAVYPGILAACIAALAVIFYPAVWLIPVEAVLLVITLWMLSFFRDPPRKIIADENTMYSPCDGKITEIAAENGEIRISMFLSIYNVHVSRAPCTCKAESIEYKKGEYRSAHDPESAQVNESNTLTLARAASPAESFSVKLVSGAVARHIVCPVKEGDALRQGERFGMIKFGSRAELAVPDSGGREVCVQVGDKVKAGITALIRYTGEGDRDG